MVASATTAVAARQAYRVVGQLGAAAGSEEEACSSRAGLGRRRAAGSAGAVASWVVVAGWMQGRGGRKVGSVGGIRRGWAGTTDLASIATTAVDTVARCTTHLEAPLGRAVSMTAAAGLA